MNPMAAVLSAMVAAASAAPTNVVAPVAPLTAAAPLTYAHAGLPLAAAAPLAYAHAPAVVAAAPAPAISVPAPYETTHVQGVDQVSIAQAPQQISKQVHYGQQTYVAGYSSEILKPAIPDISIAVPTALKGTQQINPAVVKVQKEAFVVNEPVHVEKPYAVPYDVIKHVEKIVEVPTAVHVPKPYAVPHPVPVRGEDIVKVTRTQPIVKHTHLGHRGYAGFGYAAAPALPAAAPLVGATHALPHAAAIVQH